MRDVNDLNVQITSSKVGEGLAPPAFFKQRQNMRLSGGNMTISEALEKLSSAEREIVNLKLFAGFTFEEVAGILSMPLGTVTWKYRSAINKLSNYVKEVSEI